MIKGGIKKEDTSFYKGIAILMIVSHNFLHRIPGFGLENEMDFFRSNFVDFLHHLSSLELGRIFASLFGFLGHYGVQLFILFSVYGLSVQYAKKQKSDFEFIKEKLIKTYHLLAFAIVFSLIVLAFIGIPMVGKTIVAKGFLLGSTLSSFTYNSVFAMFSGPYWFFALILQVYILFPIIYKVVMRISKRNFILLIAGSYVSIYLLYYLIEPYEFNVGGFDTRFIVFGNIIGHLPEVLLGLFMFRFTYKGFGKLIMFIAFLLFLGSQYVEFLFPFSFLSICILLIELIRQIQKIPNKIFHKVVIYIGTVSMMLFVVNGPLRSFFIFEKSLDKMYWSFSLFLLILFPLSHVLYKLYMWFVGLKSR